MIPDLREICALLRNFRDLCQSPITNSDLADFASTLDELQNVADALNRSGTGRALSPEVELKSIAA